jgi:hypothetical protein
MKMKKKWLLALTLALVLSVMPNPGPVQAQNADKTNTACLSPAMVQLKGDMDKVWIDHTIWTRSYIVSAIANSPDQKDVLNRLLQNQQDIGAVFKPYYGEAAGNKLAELLTEHIEIAGKIVAAAKAGNQADVKKLQSDWHTNADAIAAFLNQLNPGWPLKTVEDMLYTHLQLVTDIVLASLNGDWNASIAATDKNEVHMIHMADVLAMGIIKQFPDKF